MHDLHSAPASPALRPFVRAYAQRDIDQSSSDIVQPIPASLEHILEFEFFTPPTIHYQDGRRAPVDRIALVGAHSHPGVYLHLSGRVQSFAIFFEPFAMWQLFRLSARELLDTTCSAPDLLGHGINQLWSRLAECPSFELRVALVERFLHRQAEFASDRTSIMNAAAVLFGNHGTSRIQQLASDSALSLRQFERRFAEETGIGPKLFARITRFQTAVDAKLAAPRKTWLTIAHHLGYHDQTHMIRDFRSLGGAAPNQMLSQLGDTRPPALAAS